jgi:hypothetical protein
MPNKIVNKNKYPKNVWNQPIDLCDESGKLQTSKQNQPRGLKKDGKNFNYVLPAKYG